jgi:hypothetical protein
MMYNSNLIDKVARVLVWIEQNDKVVCSKKNLYRLLDSYKPSYVKKAIQGLQVMCAPINTNRSQLSFYGIGEWYEYWQARESTNHYYAQIWPKNKMNIYENQPIGKGKKINPDQEFSFEMNLKVRPLDL